MIRASAYHRERV